jgi:hypothetical protein
MDSRRRRLSRALWGATGSAASAALVVGCALAYPFDELTGGEQGSGDGSAGADGAEAQTAEGQAAGDAGSGPLLLLSFALNPPQGPYAYGSSLTATVIYMNETDASVQPWKILVAVRPDGLPHTLESTPPDDFPGWASVNFGPGDSDMLTQSQTLQNADAGRWEFYPTYCVTKSDCDDNVYHDGTSIVAQVQ